MRRVLALSLLLLPMTATAVPPPPPWLGELDALYDARLRVAGLEDRTFSPEQWQPTGVRGPDLMVDFENPLLEHGGMISGIGDLADSPARRTIDATGLYNVPFDAPDASARQQPRSLGPGTPAYFHLSRDPQGRARVDAGGDVDPARKSR